MTGLLQGKRILVTRPAEQAALLSTLIADQGGEPVVFPLLEIAPVDDQEALRLALTALKNYDFVVFISPNAVEFGLAAIFAIRTEWPCALRAVAIGPGTAAHLAARGIGPVIVPRDRFDSEAVLALPELQSERVVGKRVLILRGNGGRELLAESLLARGGDVHCVSCYRRSPPVNGKPLLSLLRNNQLDAVTISSSEGLRNLLALLDTEACEQLRSLPVFVPHQRIAEAAAENGLQGVVLTAPADAGIMEGLCAYNWFHHERYS